jgi:hypothetical protein
LALTFAATTTTFVSISGDVELNAEPTTYTTAANMENVQNISAYFPPADASTTGLITSAAQTIGGVKTFADGGIIKGRTDGVAVAANYIGEVVTPASGSAATNTSTYTTLATLTLGVGVWAVSPVSYSDDQATQTGALHLLYLKGATTTTMGKDYAKFITGAGQAHTYSFPLTIVNIASGDADKTVIVKQKSFSAAGSGSAYIQAIRIA